MTETFLFYSEYPTHYLTEECKLIMKWNEVFKLVVLDDTLYYLHSLKIPNNSRARQRFKIERKLSYQMFTECMECKNVDSICSVAYRLDQLLSHWYNSGGCISKGEDALGCCVCLFQYVGYAECEYPSLASPRACHHHNWAIYSIYCLFLGFI